MNARNIRFLQIAVVALLLILPASMALAADPITISLYHSLLKWALQINNSFVWFWTVAQWSCIARSISVDPLQFHNIKLGNDSLILKYDETKCDKEADKLTERNIYANPHDFTKCFVTGLGIHCALNQDRLSAGTSLFLNPGTRVGTAAASYQEQLMGIIHLHSEEVSQHVRLRHR